VTLELPGLAAGTSRSLVMLSPREISNIYSDAFSKREKYQEDKYVKEQEMSK